MGQLPKFNTENEDPGQSRNWVYAAFTLPKWPINQFKLVHQSRQQRLRAYCSSKYTVCVVFFAVASIFFFFFKPLFSRAWYRLDCCPMSAVENLGSGAAADWVQTNLVSGLSNQSTL